MPHHVIIDGSNLATEGRTAPSLKQLNEAVDAYRADHPEALITVVVDATFGHRIDPKEVPEFERAIETNSFVAPPAGAIGRGDGFILSIAQKVKATVLSNDSYQEFHGEYGWLFDEGRLVGGKPVPHIGWVFVFRTPVRGPVSRRSVKEQKVVEKSPGRRRGNKAPVEVSTASSSVSSVSSSLSSLPSLSANAPMPVPKSAPPGSVMPAEKPSAPKSANDLMVFLSFVEHHPVGTTVEAVVESYSSHGAYVLIGDAHGYVPLRLMGDPAPRSAREAIALGEVVTLVVHSFAPARRSIDLGVLSMSPDAQPPKPARARRGDAKKSAAKSIEKPAEKPAEKPVKNAVGKKATDKNAIAKSAAKSVEKKSGNKTKTSAKRSADVAPVAAPPAELKPVTRKAPAKKMAANTAAANTAAANPVATNNTATNNTPDVKKAAGKKVSGKKAPAPKPAAIKSAAQRAGARPSGKS